MSEQHIAIAIIGCVAAFIGGVFIGGISMHRHCDRYWYGYWKLFWKDAGHD